MSAADGGEHNGDGKLSPDGHGRNPDKQAADESAAEGRTRYFGIGCLMTVAGFFSGAMVSVLVARFVSWGTHCRYDAELPACNWPQYAAVGGLIGAVSLPALVFWQLLRPKRDNSESGDKPGDL